MTVDKTVDVALLWFVVISTFGEWLLTYGLVGLMKS